LACRFIEGLKKRTHLHMIAEAGLFA